MFNKWANHPMNSRGRDNLKETDKFWEEVYSKNKNLRFPEGKLLYRGFCCKVFQKIYFSVKLRKKTERTE